MGVGNKKGFTLIELLAVIILFGLLIGLTVPGINVISANMKKKAYNSKIELIEEAAVLWGQDHKLLIGDDTCSITEYTSCTNITVDKLLEEDYLEGENNTDDYTNPIDGNSIKYNNVEVYIKNKRVYAKYIK